VFKWRHQHQVMVEGKERKESSMLGEFGVHEPNQGRAIMRGTMHKSQVHIFFPSLI
jgi:hypothetical protein